MSITKGERTELRSIVRQQFKVLRHEVLQRQAELMADLEGQIGDRYSDEDKAWADAAHLAHEAVMEANRRVNDAFRDLTGEAHIERAYVHAMLPEKPIRHRLVIRREAAARLEAQVKGALLKLDRQEADLLRTLAIGALESDEAHGFLSAIPTVSELVPAARLAELEAEFGDSDDDG